VIVATTARELREALGSGDRSTALVPTMGALHAGHLRLIEAAAHRAEQTAVSIFVNPLQFGPDDDLDRYPQTLDADLKASEAAGVDVVFAPSVDVIYPDGSPSITVDPGPLGAELEGAVRPGHFRGVLTVVAKLFALARPDAAVFGEKDFQQLTLIRRMTSDLSLGVEIVAVPTARDSDGLALSSRNRYLSPDQRSAALALWGSLHAAEAVAGEGGEAALAAAKRVLLAEPALAVDYIELRAPDLSPAPHSGSARMLVAGRVGQTRLIDNAALELGAPVS
jgi:pantoate--beta-alanine ligase